MRISAGATGRACGAGDFVVAGGDVMKGRRRRSRQGIELRIHIPLTVGLSGLVEQAKHAGEDRSPDGCSPPQQDGVVGVDKSILAISLRANQVSVMMRGSVECNIRYIALAIVGDARTSLPDGFVEKSADTSATGRETISAGNGLRRVIPGRFRYVGNGGSIFRGIRSCPVSRGVADVAAELAATNPGDFRNGGRQVNRQCVGCRGHRRMLTFGRPVVFGRGT